MDSMQIMAKQGSLPLSERGAAMESGQRRWRFAASTDALELEVGSTVTVRMALHTIASRLDKADGRAVVPLGHGDPSPFPCFRASEEAEDAVVSAVKSGKYNSYTPSQGILPARRAVAEYLSRDLPYKLSPDDVSLTLGCSQAIDIVLTSLARPGANILLPRPGFPMYELCCSLKGIEVRHFDLCPDRCWEVDLEAVEAIADDNSVALVIINPGNPCGNVYSYGHLSKVAKTARRLGLLVIADEVYHHLTFGGKPFVPMGVFGEIAPVLTLGSISKRWLVPGWRLGWIATTDPQAILKKTKFIDRMMMFLSASTDPPHFMQAAISEIIQATTQEFSSKTISLLRQTADMTYDSIRDISCFTCPFKPDGSMFVLVKLDLTDLDDILDDMDFCCKLAKEESVIILPGIVLGCKNWLRMTFAVEPSLLEDGLGRLKLFCQRHKRKSIEA